MRESHLLHQLAHVLGARARGSLIGHRSRPLDHVRLEQSVHAHEHQAHGAVAADVIAHVPGERILDHVHVDRIENDDRIVLHAKRGRCVDPVPFPSRGAQPREHLVSVVAALAGDHDIHRREFFHALRILERRSLLADERAQFAHPGGREKHRFDQREIAFGVHALHQHRSDHPAPTDKPDSLHRSP